ncbi:conjugal transfer protein [Kitasatospora sp. NPDC004723]|uniref:conjugal transfer protein n=1 Tax=Kitasatospora sp. NPDC004723 TaxID=3154288 RepID=UPI0033AEC716
MQTGAAQPPANPWEAAGAALAQQAAGPAADQAAPPATPTPPPAAAVPWLPETEKPSALHLRRVGRVTLWAVVVLAAVTGVRSWIVPPKAPPPAAPAPTQSAPAYPAEEAQALAARFARAYLGWDETTPQQRVAALAPLLPTGTDPSLGWNGKGRQEVVDVQAGAVTVGAQGQARVRVEALIRSAAAAAPATAPQWVALEVPVAVASSGRMAVTGEPGLVGLPSQGPSLPRLTTAEVDSALSTESRPAVEAFFKAYAGGTVATAAAPGAAIPPLPDGVEFSSVAAWSVDRGDGSDRTGTARISWTLGAATVEQTYRVRLTRVTSAAAATWQVAAVYGGTG